MNTTISVRERETPPLAQARRVPLANAATIWRAFVRRVFPAPVRGNLLHEAWSADGEPMERQRPTSANRADDLRRLSHMRPSVGR